MCEVHTLGRGSIPDMRVTLSDGADPISFAMFKASRRCRPRGGPVRRPTRMPGLRQRGWLDTPQLGTERAIALNRMRRNRNLYSVILVALLTAHSSAADRPSYTAYLISPAERNVTALGYGISFGKAVGYVTHSTPSGDTSIDTLWDLTTFRDSPLKAPTNFTGVALPGVIATSISGDMIGGVGHPNVAGRPYDRHAVLWRAGSEAATDLNPKNGFESDLAPSGFDSGINALNSRYQVGWGVLGGTMHALVWQGTAESVVDLNPRGIAYSSATCVAGNTIGGWLGVGSSRDMAQYSKPVIWRGSNHRMVALSTIGFGQVHGVSCDGSAVGQGAGYLGDGSTQIGPPKAVLWPGNSSNVVVLHSNSFHYTIAWDVSGDVQVGQGQLADVTSNTVALAWFGSAASVVNLHSFLPTGYKSSMATKIDEFGNILGTASYETNMAIGGADVRQLVAWVPNGVGRAQPELRIAQWCDSRGHPEIQIKGFPGKSYVLEKTIDFQQWRPLITQQAVTPLLYFTDLQSDLNQYVFYRVREGM